ncbi:hypothetical protein M2281_004415 [Mesorhizobium soli]|uniref:hypothetical protein n=1 Tax=Pseudaminobacter soli (ex Li et al. 2025) TaxID=1295366 RepID=UPI002475DD97|nr:hypothetical protein [Mesorhizobium soli]MDH6233802.1 hypothetical protein [Mesorhizobium soli]
MTATDQLLRSPHDYIMIGDPCTNAPPELKRRFPELAARQGNAQKQWYSIEIT